MNLLQDSGNTEWYTPSDIIEAARVTMGGIDFDPFSCETANKTVDAKRFFTKECDGFSQNWDGRVWCNHPFSRSNNSRIFDKAIGEYEKGNASSICMITFASTSEKWFVKSLRFPQCFLHGRTNYFDIHQKKVKGVTKGSVVTYIGKDVNSFYNNFNSLGTVKVPYTQGE